MSPKTEMLTVALAGGSGESAFVDRALSTVRTHLNMDIAYLSEFVDGRSVFRAVNAPGLEAAIKVGDSVALADVYCQHILEGRLPEMILDTADEPLAAALPITAAAPIGSHVSIPIRREDGSAYGMFCCLSARPNPSLNARDLEIMRGFADLAAREVNRGLEQRQRRDVIDAGMALAFAPGGHRIAYQPIFMLDAPAPGGFEALCRFTAEPYRTPDVWFDDAAKAGRQLELEVHVIASALGALRDLPNSVYVSVNASPATVIDGDLDVLFAGYPCERIVLELTEHAQILDYPGLDRALAALRFKGVTLAIDDTGAGYSGLQQIVRLRPDILKLDMSLTRGIDADPAKRSLAAALVHFARETRAEIVAEGIETEAELATLRALGVQRGQGYLLGKPQDLATARAWFDGAGLTALSA